MLRARPLLSLLLSLAALAATPAAAQEDAVLPDVPPELTGDMLRVGPVVGHVDADHALLWARALGTRTVDVTLDDQRRTLAFEPLGRGFGVIRLDGLRPERPYQVRVELPGAPAPTEVRFRTAPPARSWGRVRFGVGSCAADAQQPIWKQVAAADLDLFVWVGDNTYYRSRERGPDWSRIEWMLERQLDARGHALQAMQGMACYATWDDHDYGPNNSDRHFALRAEARLVHRYMWANPGYGQGGEGVYFTFRRGPVAFFVLDGRSFKDVRPDLPADERQLYGPAQLAWLRRELAASDAPLKVIACGVQQLLGYGPAEGWHQALAERVRFLDWLEGAEVGPLLFLSGDIHVSELYRVELGAGAAAWELTSSGLARESGVAALFELAERPERRWIVTRPNFCVVEVDVPRDPARLAEATLRFASVGVDGAVIQETRATFASFGAALEQQGF